METYRSYQWLIVTSYYIGSSCLNALIERPNLWFVRAVCLSRGRKYKLNILNIITNICLYSYGVLFVQSILNIIISFVNLYGTSYDRLN